MGYRGGYPNPFPWGRGVSALGPNVPQSNESFTRLCALTAVCLVEADQTATSKKRSGPTNRVQATCYPFKQIGTEANRSGKIAHVSIRLVNISVKTYVVRPPEICVHVVHPANNTKRAQIPTHVNKSIN
jgi:sorbitol-specific phosphotransferase system component IIA